MTRRVLMTADAIGGVWQYALDLSAQLVGGGWSVDLALLGPSPLPAQRAQVTAIGATLLDTGLPLDWLAPDPHVVAAAAAQVAALARSRGADVVHLNQPALAVADFAMPVVAVVHSCVASWWDAVETGPLPAGLAWQTDLVARGLSRADAIVCPTRAFAATVQRLYALPAAPLAIHNGRAFATATAPMRDAAFTAGRLWDRGKNVATLDRAAASLALPFAAAGAAAGPHGEAIAVGHLHLLGHLADDAVAVHLAARPVFASAALYEPFGLAVLEAARAGCALVLSDIPTFRELWDGVATFVPATDAGAVARAIDRIVGDPATRVAHGDAARARALEYTPERSGDAVMSLYERVVAADRRVAA